MQLKLLTRFVLLPSLVTALITGAGSAAALGERAETQLAALALPTGARADWQQWDLFFLRREIASPSRDNKPWNAVCVEMTEEQSLKNPGKSGAFQPDTIEMFVLTIRFGKALSLLSGG